MNAIIKLIRKTLQYFLLGISYCCIRNKIKWVFGCHTGFMDNPKYLMLQRVSLYPCTCYWISSSKEDVIKVQKIGLKAYHKNSILGIYHCLTAGVYIYSHDLYDINKWLSGGAKRICLWHGVGIKKIGGKTLSKHSYGQYPDIFLSTSPFMTTHFKYYLHLPDTTNIIESMYPRCEILLYPNHKLIDHIKKYEGENMMNFVNRLKTYNKVYLYMPTWRDDKRDFISYSEIDFEQLNQILEQQNSLFILKLHPNTNLTIQAITQYNNIHILQKSIDIYPILPFTDVLITDYSSIYYDYLLLNKDVILFLFDFDNYLKNCRDLAYDFNQYTTFGKKVYCFSDLLALIKQKNEKSKKCNDLKKIFWANNKNAFSLISEIQKTS